MLRNSSTAFFIKDHLRFKIDRNNNCTRGGAKKSVQKLLKAITLFEMYVFFFALSNIVDMPGFYKWHCEKLYFPLNYLQIHLEKTTVKFIFLFYGLGAYLGLNILILPWELLISDPALAQCAVIFAVIAIALIEILYKCIKLEKKIDSIVKCLDDIGVHPLKNKHASLKRTRSLSNLLMPFSSWLSPRHRPAIVNDFIEN